MSLIFQIIAGFLSGLIGSMGFGGGAVLIIYLTIFANTPQLKAQGINLIFFIPCAIVAVIIYTIKKQIDYKQILPVILGGVIGAVISSLILSNININYLSKIFGVFLIFMAIYSLFGLKKKGKCDKIN